MLRKTPNGFACNDRKRIMNATKMAAAFGARAFLPVGFRKKLGLNLVQSKQTRGEVVRNRIKDGKASFAALDRG